MDIVGEEEEEEEEEEKALFHSVFFPIPSQFFLCIFLTREGRWFRPALKPLAGAHAWINGWRGQKSRSGLLEFSFGGRAKGDVGLRALRICAQRMKSQICSESLLPKTLCRSNGHCCHASKLNLPRGKGGTNHEAHSDLDICSL